MDNNPICLTIPGDPIAKARPKWAKWGMFSPKKTVNYEVLIKETFAICYPRFQPLTCPVSIVVDAYFRIPKSASKKKQMLMDSGHIEPCKKPDASNILKIIEDALNGLAYHDDVQITEAHIIKRYDREPRVEIQISWKDNEKTKQGN